MRVSILAACLLLLVPAFVQGDCQDCQYTWQNKCLITAQCIIPAGQGMYDNCTVYFNEMPDPSCPDHYRVFEFCDGNWCYWT